MLALCRRQITRGDALSILSSIRDQALGPAVLELAGRQRVLGLILHALAGLDLFDADHGLGPGAELRAAYLVHGRHSMIVELECDRVLSQFAQRCITPLLLKGGALRRTVYAAAVERPMIDLDLLIEDGELDATLALLEKAGYEPPRAVVREAYQRHHFHIPVAHAGFEVEVHWALSRPVDPHPLDVAWFRRNSGPQPTDSPSSFRIPSLAALLLHTASQSASDAFGSLRHVIDTDRILAQPGAGAIDWEDLGEAAQRAGLTRALAHLLSLAERLLGTSVPPGAPIMPRVTRVHLAMLPASPFAPPERRRPAALRLIQWWILPGPGARLRETLRTIRTAHDPMEWLWHELRGLPQPTSRALDGIRLVSKQGVHQIGAYFGQVLPRRFSKSSPGR